MTFDGMSKAELALSRIAITALHGRLMSVETKCDSCQSRGGRYNAERVFESFCRHWQATIPPDVLPVGCDAWTYESIPF